MKKKYILLSWIFVSLIACGPMEANTVSRDNSDGPNADGSSQMEKPLRISILGDSYSTFEGYIPEGYIAWYKPVPKEGRPTDVTKPEQTWWQILIDKNGYELDTNNSYSGSTVCNTGYEGKDYSDRSFVSRVGGLGNPDLIYVFGGTNDSWANSPLGDYVWSGWTPSQLYEYRPALAYSLYKLQELYPEAQTIFIINDDIKDEIKESTKEVCDKYGVAWVQLKNIEKMSGHPDRKGMLQIVDQLTNSRGLE